MNAYDKLIISVFFFAIIVWQALHQAHLFKQNEIISHFWKGITYGVGVGFITIIYISVYDWWYLLKIPILGVIIRIAFFDITLNSARGRSFPWWYNGSISGNPAQKPSLIDKIENKIVGVSIKGKKILKIVYIIIFIAAIIFIK